MISIRISISITIRRLSSRLAGLGAPRLIEGNRNLGRVIEDKRVEASMSPEQWAEHMEREIERYL